jgi:hypothetical protein
MTSGLESMSAQSLITASRLDVFSKIDFVQTYLDGFQTSWAKSIYRGFLSASRPDGKFDENGSKFSLEDYERDFIQLIESCKKNGYQSSISRIPTTKNGIVNGAHRLAVALCLNLEVSTEAVDEEDQIYDYRFMNRIGLSSNYRQQMAWNLVSRRQDSRVFLLTNLNDEVEKKVVQGIREFAEIVTVERINLTKIGERRLMELAYGHNDWWRPQFRESMVSERFSSGDNTCTAVFTIGSDSSRAQEQKLSIRKLLGSEHFDRQIHGSDNFSDTITLAEVLLNRNGVHFMNTAPIDSESRIFDLLGGHKIFEDTAHVQIPWCIDGSAVLEMYGIRRARDIDFIAMDVESMPREIRNIGDNHISEFSKYPIGLEEVILDPRLHFRYKGNKLMSLSTLTFIKSSLLDIKAVEDINLISKFYEFGGPTYVDGDLRNKARLWKIELLLNSILTSLISPLPEKMRNSVKSFLSRVRTLVFD